MRAPQGCIAGRQSCRGSNPNNTAAGLHTLAASRLSTCQRANGAIPLLHFPWEMNGEIDYEWFGQPKLPQTICSGLLFEGEVYIIVSLTFVKHRGKDFSRAGRPNSLMSG